MGLFNTNSPSLLDGRCIVDGLVLLTACKTTPVCSVIKGMSTLSELRAWLRDNGFTIIREGIGSEGIELTVRAHSGRIVLMSYKPGLVPTPGAQSLEDVLIDEINVQR
jgi:hypothetical protein